MKKKIILFIVMFFFISTLSSCIVEIKLKTTNASKNTTSIIKTTFENITNKSTTKTTVSKSTTISITESKIQSTSKVSTSKQTSSTTSKTTKTTTSSATTKTTTSTSSTTKSNTLTLTSSSKQVLNYYKNFDINTYITYNVDDLIDEVYELISDANISVSYTNSKYYFYRTDCNPDTGKIQLFYTHLEVSASSNHELPMGSKTGEYNREHVWPQSLGHDKDEPGGHDLHHIRPTLYDLNSARGSLKYGNCKSTGTAIIYNKVTYAYKTSNCFEPLDNVKGDVARIIFYYAIKYNYKLSTVVTDSTYKEILEWNRLDPVSEVEINRNNEVEDIQGNRNIFIDYPELAEYIWGSK